MGKKNVRKIILFFLSVVCAVNGFVTESCLGAVFEIYPATAGSQEEFETAANSLKPGDELILHGGLYSQNSRRSITVNGSASKPVIIRAADEEKPLLSRPADNMDKYNNIEFIDCSYLIVRGIRFKGGNSGVRFIRGHHITFEECEIFETGNNALTMNSGDCDAFIIRKNHIHHTGLSKTRRTEGEGMYIGCHDGSCVTTNSLFEGNYIHHTRGTSNGGNDGIEIKFGSYGNVVRANVIHDTNIGKQFPGIFVYGSSGKGINIVEGNVIWNAGEGIQVVSDAIIRNNIISNCFMTGITAAGHNAVPYVSNVKIVNNTIVNHPKGVLIRWENARDMVFANNAVYCHNSTAIDAQGTGNAVFAANFVQGLLKGVKIDGAGFCDGGSVYNAFVEPDKRNYWPKRDSVLIEKGVSDFAPELDFNRTPRRMPFDVGAYESEGNAENPGLYMQRGNKDNR